MSPAMPAGGLAIALVAILVAPIATGLITESTPQISRLEPREAIRILSDADFDAAHGVRSGAGSAEDPYVIADWMPRQETNAAVIVRNTSAYVVFRNILVGASNADPFASLACLRGTDERACHDPRGFEIMNASNVTLEAVHVLSQTDAVLILDATNVAVRNSTLGLPRASPNDPTFMLGFGFHVIRSSMISIANTSVHGAIYPLSVFESDRVDIEHTTFESPPTISGINKVRGLTIKASRFEGFRLQLRSNLEDFTIVGNAFMGNASGLGSDVFTLPLQRRGLVCGNLFEGQATLEGSLALYRPIDVEISGNRFARATRALVLSSASSVTLARNEILPTSNAIGLVVQTSGAGVARAYDNILLAGVEASGVVDARSNWWGHPTGPSGVAEGQGTLLRAVGNVSYQPWLTQAPSAIAACAPGRAPDESRR